LAPDPISLAIGDCRRYVRRIAVGCADVLGWAGALSGDAAGLVAVGAQQPDVVLPVVTEVVQIVETGGQGAQSDAGFIPLIFGDVTSGGL
jgi:hypothetical protein